MRNHSFTYVLASIAAFILALSPPADARKKRRRRASVGYLTLDSMTDDARVYIDGKFIGKTPFNKRIKLRTGKHKFKATKPGYLSSEMDFTIRRRRKTEISVDLLPSSGIVKFECNIKGAEVYVDGNMIGNIPLIKDIPIGKHVVTITKETFNDFTTELQVKAGEKAFVKGKLTPFKAFTAEALAIKKAKEKAKKEAELKAKLESSPPEAVTESRWYDNWYEKWWFWTAVGVVVVTSVAVPVAASSGGAQAGLNAHTSPIDPIELK